MVIFACELFGLMHKTNEVLITWFSHLNYSYAFKNRHYFEYHCNSYDGFVHRLLEQQQTHEMHCHPHYSNISLWLFNNNKWFVEPNE